jgi:hypothetical protein
VVPAKRVLRDLAPLRVRQSRRALTCLLALALTLTLASFLLVTAPSEGQSWSASWTQRANPSRGPSGWVAAAFDTVNARAVLFGGGPSESQSDVWQYDVATDSWAQLESHEQCPPNFTPPTGRHGYALEYDPINQLFWMFGGSGAGCNGPARTAERGTLPNVIVDHTLTATTFDFYKDWTVSVNGTTAYVVAYNPWSKILFLTNSLVLAPGRQYFLYPQRGGGTFGYSPVTKSWSSLTGPHWGYPGPNPSNRLSPAMAYSTRDTAMVMFGGAGQNDTWALDSETRSWVQKISSQAPGSPPSLAQLANSMVYDRNNDVFILFGGCRCTGDSGPSSGETWAYRLSTNAWTKMTPAVSPPPRQGHNLVYDSRYNVVVLFGGIDVPSARYYNDLWIYSYPTNTWTQVSPSVSPPGRRGGAMVYDPVSQRTILYGGTSQAAFHDVWALQLQGPTPGNPAPALTSLSQDSAMAGGSPFTLAVTGANFVASSAVRWNGVSRPTAYVRSTQLQASISAADIASVGTAKVSVTTPVPGGGSSNSLPFVVTAPKPAPSLTSINPTTVAAGGGAVTLTATGTNFAGTSVLRVNGSNRATTVVSATQLTTTILASDLAAAGALSISVLTPAPGGGTSAGRILTVSVPSPAVSATPVPSGSTVPATVPAGPVTATPVPPGGSVTAPVTLSLVFDGMLRDRVGQGVTAAGSDGAMDGTLTATLSAGRTVTALRLDSDQVGTWVTGQNPPNYWVLGVALSLGGSLLNAPNTMAVNFPVASGGSFVVFASDALNREFVPGAKLTLVATFSDGSKAAASTTVPMPPSPPTLTSGSSAGQTSTGSAPSPAVSATPVPSGSTVPATVPTSSTGSTSAPALVPVGTILPATLPGSAQTAPVGTWATMPNTAIYSVMPPEATSCAPPLPSNCGQAELWSPFAVFGYSGGDLATINGKLGMVMWGGGHHDSPDNSLYFSPLDGSGPKRLSGPFLIPPGGDYFPQDGQEAYLIPSRNQPPGTGVGAPKSRHTYSCITTVTVNGTQQFFTYGGGLASLSGFGTNRTRLFDLSQTYAQAMARADMGWALKADAPAGTLTCTVAWDSKAGVVVVRARTFYGSYNPTTDKWERWGDTAGGSDYEAQAAIDVEGRKMYVLGNHIAEVIDLDTRVLTQLGTWDGTAVFPPTAPAWVRGFVLPYNLPGAYLATGVQWHPGRKRIIAYANTLATNGTEQNLLQIDPVTGTIDQLTMGGVPVRTRVDYGIYGRFRLIPGTDTVVLAGYVQNDMHVGQLPASGTTPVPVATTTPTPAPTPTPTPVATAAAVVAPASTLKATYLGLAGDKVGPGNQLMPDGQLDNRVTLQGLRANLVKLTITDGQEGKWENPYNGGNWNILIAPVVGTTSVDAWFSSWVTGRAFHVKATYGDGTTDEADAVSAAPISVPAPTPVPVAAPTPVPAPAPTSAPAPTGGASPSTVWVKPGDPLPVRQWVERLNGVAGQPGPNCNPSQVWIAEFCGKAPGKHHRTFYHPGLKGMVMAGGDHAVGMPFPGPYDGNGSEVLLYQPDLEKWTTLRPLCVTGETQPSRPDNVIWALDVKRNRAIMAPGYYVGPQYAGQFPLPRGPSGCDAVEGVGSYVYDFSTNKFTGPDDPGLAPAPPGNWGGDTNATFGVIDPVNDELLVLDARVGLTRMNLATRTWRTTPVPVLHAPNAQTVIDVQGRALYYLAPFGLAGTSTSSCAPNDEACLKSIAVANQQAYLVKVFLDDPTGKSETIPLPWPYQPYGADVYLVFDTINRVVFVPNNVGMGGLPLAGLGIYHVDTKMWEWEDTPAAVQSSLFGFDENLGVMVATSNRSVPYATYLYKYGGAIKPLPIQPPPPVVQTTALLSESFNRPDGPGLGPDQPWTVVEDKVQTMRDPNFPPGNHAAFVPDPNATPILPPYANQLIWASARVEKDLPSADMEVWMKIPILEGGGGYLHEVTQCVAARFSTASATYYAVCLGIGEGQHLRIIKVVNGVRTILGPDIENSINITDQTYNSDIRIRVTGSGPSVTITSFYRGKPRQTIVDSAPDRITQGARAGIAGQGYIASRAYMDDWRAGVTAVTP